MRRRLPGLSVGLAASLRSMPTDYCEVLKSPSAGADKRIPFHRLLNDKQNMRFSGDVAWKCPGRIDPALGRLDLAPGRIDMAPGRIDMAPGRIDMAPGRIDMAPGRIDMTPGRIDMTPGRIDMTSGRIDTASGRRPGVMSIRQRCRKAPRIS